MLGGAGWPFDFVLGVLTTFAVVYAAIKVNKHLIAYMTVPVLLVWLHVGGSVLQDRNIGPEWVQGHLHNIGAPVIVMFFAFCGMRGLIARHLKTGMSFRRAGSKAFMTCVLYGWIGGVVVGCLIEVADVTVSREENMAQGYSGQLDWGDLVSYGLSAAIMIFNHIKIAPIVLTRRTRRRR